MSEARYKLALERIVDLGHDVACSGNAPLSECGCFEKSPLELAKMALDGIDWEPAPRKTRALEHFVIPEGADEHPFWDAYRLAHTALSRLSEEDFASQPLDYGAIESLAVKCMTDDERKQLAEISAADGEHGVFSYALSEFMQTSREVPSLA